MPRLAKVVTTVEWCAHCEEEVNIPVNTVSNCPSCGASIRPCNDCPRDMPAGCDWRDDGYCCVFPDFRYTDDNKEETCKTE